MISEKCLLLIFMTLVGWSNSISHDDNFCKLITTDESRGKFPPLPESFSYMAEIKSRHSVNLTYVRVKSNARGGRVEYRSNDVHLMITHVKETNEIIVVNMQMDTFDKDACNIFMPEDPQTRRQFDDLDVFQLLMYPMQKKYIGSTTVRGILGDKLEGCEFLNVSPPYSLKVEWVIANNKSAVGETDLISVPLQMKVTQHDYVEGKEDTEKTFEFFEFRSSLPDDEDILLIPNRYYCTNKNNTRPLPELANFFSFKSEIRLEGAKPNYLFEEYNYFMGLTRMDFYARYPYQNYKKYGKGLLTRIHDFNMNLEFIHNRQSGKCFYQVINESSVDTRRVNNTFYWRMLDPAEFFHLEPNRTFQYSGQMKTRGQWAHVFVSQREVSVELESNLKISVNGTYTWYFVENKNSNTESEKVDYIPIRMEYYSELENYDLNIYDFKTQEPTLMEFSVNDCFEDLPQEQFVMQFNVKRAIADHIDEHRDLFQHWFEVALALGSKISFLRVRINEHSLSRFTRTRARLYVRFTLFEKPSIVGVTEDAPLADGVTALFESVDGSKFTFLFPNANNNLESISVPRGTLKRFTNTIANEDIQGLGFVDQLETKGEKETPRRKVGGGGISNGMFAFLMIATLFVGSVVGSGILYIVYRKNNQLPGASGMNYVKMKVDN